MLDGIKDAVVTNVTNAVRGGQLKIEAAQVERLLMLITQSADEGFHKAHKSFMKTVEASLVEASVPPTDPAKKK